MMISVLRGVTRTSTPLYPSSANSRFKNSFSSALNTPSATNFHPTVSILSQLPLQEFIQFSFEHSVSYELPLLRDLSGHYDISDILSSKKF